ncbi:solute carrier family 15 member 4-like [Oculina patagonica]
MASRKKDELSEILVDSTETQAENSGSHLQEPPTSTKTRYLVVLCILVVELCERLTFYGVTANLVFYCKDVLKLDSPLPSTIALAFQGTCFFTPIIGGWLADTKIGRYNAIYGCSLLYIVGTILLTTITYNYPPAYALSMAIKEGFLAVSLILIAIATGGIKANVGPIGADQVQEEGPEMVQKFFNWFYWFIQIGSLLSFTAVVYVQQEISFFYGYLITVVSMACGTILLVIGRKHYILHPPQGSYLADTLRIIGRGLKDKLCCKKTPLGTHWLDGAKHALGGKYSDEMVEGVKSVVRLIPIFLTFIFYWTIYGQGSTTFLLQGSYMNLKVTDKLSFPAASLNIFGLLSLLILIPFIDRVVYPGLHRVGLNFSPLRRIGVGMLFAACSMALAGAIEVERKHDYGTFEQVVLQQSVNASTMSVFYQVPQYILQGISEALVSVTGLEFAYSQSPADLRSVVMGVCVAMIGLGYYVASLLAYIVKHASHGNWYPDDLNKGTLEYYMFLLAGLMLINAAVFLFLAVRYRYADTADKGNPVNDDHSEGETSQGIEKPNTSFFCDNAQRPLINNYNIFCDIRNYGP